VFEPSSVEANTSVTLTLTLDVPAGTDEVVVPVPDAFTLFGCTAPAGWTCSATALGALPASATIARDGDAATTVAITMDLRTPTAGGDYAFGDDVLVVTGGFEGGPTAGDDVPGDDPVIGMPAMPLREAGSPSGDGEVVPAIVAALVLLVVALAAYRAIRRDQS
jgi:hypothetical protein